MLILEFEMIVLDFYDVFGSNVLRLLNFYNRGFFCNVRVPRVGVVCVVIEC